MVCATTFTLVSARDSSLVIHRFAYEELIYRSAAITLIWELHVGFKFMITKQTDACACSSVRCSDSRISTERINSYSTDLLTVWATCTNRRNNTLAGNTIS